MKISDFECVCLPVAGLPPDSKNACPALPILRQRSFLLEPINLGQLAYPSLIS